MKHSHSKEDRSNRICALAYDYKSQPKQRRTACNLCGSTSHTVITHVDRYGYEATASACSTCGLTFLNPVMTDEAYGDFYASTYRPLVSAYHGRLINSETIQEEQRTYALDLIKFLRPWLTYRSLTTLLDIGGSTGVVSMEITKAFPVKATILDPAADELDCAKKNGMETIKGFLEQYEPEGRQFDVVTLCQTIDHLLDVSGSLRKVRDLLKPDGIFFVDIVDFRAAYLRQRSVEGAVKIDHPYYFTESTVEAMLSRIGFKVLQKSYAADHLHIGYLCVIAPPQPESLPTAVTVSSFFSELRYVQNLSRE